MCNGQIKRLNAIHLPQILFMPIQTSTFKFLKDLSANNDRDWFNTNKDIYLKAQNNAAEFADKVISLMKKHDEIENESGKKSLYRIYNDVRFSKDKSPYSGKFAFSLKRATKLNRGGYYVHLKPENSFLACGFFAPNPEDLKRIRLDIDVNYKDWNKVLKSKSIAENFGSITGDKVKSAPRGFAGDHPGIELLRLKQFVFRHNFTDKEVLSDNFDIEVNRIFKTIRPWFNYMSEVLTTDLNGELIV
jgi:uncharacterized protein (TIGR02453 family)